MIQLLGALLVITSCVFFGYRSLSKSKESLAALQQLTTVLRELSRHISFHLEPVPEAISRLQESLSYGEDSFLTLVEQGIKKDPSGPISIPWKEAAGGFCTRFSLPEKVISELSRLGESLGKTDYQAECDRLDGVSGDLEMLFKEWKARCKKRSRP